MPSVSNNINLNNEVILTGTVASDLTFSHEVYGEGFYSFFLDVPRLSDTADRINVTISERLAMMRKMVKFLSRFKMLKHFQVTI